MNFLLIFFFVFPTILSNPLTSTLIDFQNENIIKNIDELEPRMEFVGEINGKFYYYNTQTMDYSGAVSYCSGLGMELAWFDTPTESDFVRDRTPDQRYWLNAMDWMWLDDFRWTHNGGAIPNHPFSQFSNSRAGLLYNSIQGYQFEGYLTQSRLNATSYYPLCILKTRETLAQPNHNDTYSLTPIIDFDVRPQEVKEYIKTPFEIGPLSSSVKELQPRLNFIGEINGKHFYYFDDLETYLRSKAACEGVGMEMAFFDSLTESNFVWDRIDSGYYWTNSEQRYSLNDFLWRHNGGSVIGWPLAYMTDSTLGLVYSGYANKHLIQTAYNLLCIPLCLIR